MSKFYREVQELPEDCIYELKMTMFYGDDDHDPLFDCFECPSEIPDQMVFHRFSGITFVPDDFWNDSGDWEDAIPMEATFSEMTAPLDSINNLIFNSVSCLIGR